MKEIKQITRDSLEKKLHSILDSYNDQVDNFSYYHDDNEEYVEYLISSYYEKLDGKFDDMIE
jgi:hypothetical protein